MIFLSNQLNFALPVLLLTVLLNAINSCCDISIVSINVKHFAKVYELMLTIESYFNIYRLQHLTGCHN